MTTETIITKVTDTFNKIEKWSKIDLAYVFKGGFWLAAGQVFSVAVVFLLSIIFANLVPKEIYGKYKYVLSVIGIISIPTLAGINSALTRAIAKNFDGTMMVAIKTRMKWGLLSLVFGLILSGYYYINGNAELATAFVIVAFFLPFVDPMNSYNAFINGKKLFKHSFYYSVVMQIIILLMTAPVVYFTQNLYLLIFVYFASRTVVNVVLLRYTVKKLEMNDKVDYEAISYGKHLTNMNIISLLASQLDRVLIFHYMGPIQLATYSFALNPTNQINSGILKNIAALAMPKFAENDIGTLKNTLPLKTLKFAIVTTVIALSYVFCAPFIYKTFFKQYTESIIYSQFMAITVAILPFSLFNVALTAQKGQKELYFSSYSSSILKILLLFFLLPSYGITGAIIATITPIFYSNIVSYYLFKKMS